ncbi:hypothetical protein [Paraburkholderia sp. BL10I2N1]|uniref:hypothetical protein n=1 Tax=Paraburkholderia sp. BL10I2N1 TaxID=1938796 RepID=UPI0010608D2D|nr:hypothetical protein [Paraburkholderia sp. BL10I2N1]TDN69558.1 hypothetical protein B0G77_2958 [Paraburkholderia sp. BL10I2N1]
MKRITSIFAIAATAALAGCAVYPDGTPAYGGGYDPGYGYGYGAAPVPQSNVYLGFGGYSGPSYYDHGYGRGYDRGYDHGYNHDRPPPPPQQQGHGGGPGPQLGGGPAPQAGNGWRGGGPPGAGVGHPTPTRGGGQGGRGDRDSERQSAQDYNNGGGSRH